MSKRAIYIGFDPKEIAAYLVAVNSIYKYLSQEIPIYALELSTLTSYGWYSRATEVRDGRLYDVISEHPMSTEFAVSRFLVPQLARTGWALFADCDVLARDDLAKLFALADPRYAVMCVKHNHVPAATEKMDGQVQSRYFRKNWSSVCLWNCDHPSNKKLTVHYVNSVPGRDLHAFSWLTDDEIGELPVEYNFLVGVTPLKGTNFQPKLVHFTEATPHVRGYENCEYADEWRRELTRIIPNTLRVYGTLPAK